MGVAIGSPACGTLGIDLPGGTEQPDGLAGSGPDGAGGRDDTNPASGGTNTASGGETSGSGGDDGAGGGGTSSGGADGSGGTASGGSDGSGGENSGGTAGAGGSSGGSSGDGGSSSGGSGGSAADCDVADPTCAALVAALVNRYSFDGTGATIVDSVGSQDGTAEGSGLDGTGELDFSGPGDSVSLPSGLVSSLPNATIEVWFEWDGGEQWQWLFAFGHKQGPASPSSYFYATPEAGGAMAAQNALAAGIRHEDTGDRQLRTMEFTATGVLTQVVLVVSDTADRLSLYKNGAWIADRDTDVHLEGIDDDTNNLGRSLVTGDPPFEGRITEFRIYGDALTAEMIQKSFELGPDATFSP